MVNPYGRQIYNVDLTPDGVDGFVFWTKNVGPFLEYLPEVHERGYPYRRDVTLAEDGCQVRIAGAPQALAVLNRGVLALMDWLQVRNVASQMRHFCTHPHEVLLLLCGTLSWHNG